MLQNEYGIPSFIVGTSDAVDSMALQNSLFVWPSMQLMPNKFHGLSWQQQQSLKSETETFAF